MVLGATDHGEQPFAGLPPVPRVEWDKQTLLGHQREMLGLYVSDHPLMGLEHVVMLPAMLAAMLLRPAEYTACHVQRRRSHAAIAA